MRRGFTLIEIVVALVLFEIGMLALTALSAVATRDFLSATRRASAQAIARNRVELLRAAACGGEVVGQARAGTFDERWRVSRDGGVARLSDSVAFPLPRGRRGAVGASGYVPCHQ